MTLPRGRVLRATETGQLVRVTLPGASPLPKGRVVERELVDAAERASRIVADAERRAQAILEQAALQAGDVRVKAEAEGRAEGVATLAARALALSALEARADEQALERSVGLARVLAERLLGEELRLDPARVAALARQALAEARGARRARIVAHPDDATLLEPCLAELGLGAGAVSIAADPTRTRGSLRLETDIGVLDAELAPQLDRLTERLRRTLGG